MNKLVKANIVLLLLLSINLSNAQKRRSNPIVSHMFTADASAHVWEDGRLYVYPSSDHVPPRGYRTMDGYHVFSTDDMITWKDHGEILHSRDVSWGTEKGGLMWAPDCAYKNGIYFYYFPHKNKENVWEIGIATSNQPASNFKVQGFVKGGNAFCDPCVFIDEDGQAYLYAVKNAKCYAAKLKENMMEIHGSMDQQVGVDEHREGPFVFKRNGKYYMIYPDHHRPHNQMQYSMADNPLGPWEPKGLFVEQTDVITMHGSVVEYKDQWYLFYHNGSLSGGIGPNRSICFDPVYFNDDGSIQMVKQTLGVDLPTFHNAIHFNEMFGALQLGSYTKAQMKKLGILPNAISSIQIPEGYIVECFDKDKFKGKSWRFEEDRIDLSQIACDDVISSIRILKSKSENLVKNPSFELATLQQIKYWRSKSLSPSWYRDETSVGYYSMQYKGKGKAQEKVQKVQLMPNTNYELSVSLKIEKGTEGKVLFDTQGAFDETCKFELDTNGQCDKWTDFKATFNSGQTTHVNLRCTTTADFNGTCYWDNVVLKVK